MPNVSSEFVKHAVVLAKHTKEALGKEAAVDEALMPQIEMAADTLIEQGLIPPNQKQAAVDKLRDHAETLQALNKTAQMVRPESMGTVVSETEKTADVNSHRGDEVRESDRVLLRKLGITA